eukprot:2724851-Prorocentrum_lima.AAC.1
MSIKHGKRTSNMLRINSCASKLATQLPPSRPSEELSSLGWFPPLGPTVTMISNEMFFLTTGPHSRS